LHGYPHFVWLLNWWEKTIKAIICFGQSNSCDNIFRIYLNLFAIAKRPVPLIPKVSFSLARDKFGVSQIVVAAAKEFPMLLSS